MRFSRGSHLSINSQDEVFKLIYPRRGQKSSLSSPAVSIHARHDPWHTHKRASGKRSLHIIMKSYFKELGIWEKASFGGGPVSRPPT